MMSKLEDNAAYFQSLADVLIPNYQQMPAFSAVCSIADVARCVEFRPDVADDFNRAVTPPAGHTDARASLVRLADEDPTAFSALGLIVASAYHMAPRVRELIGYPGQESKPVRPGEAESYLSDGILNQVIERGQRYVPTPVK
jgi:hypothetical protein